MTWSKIGLDKEVKRQLGSWGKDSQNKLVLATLKFNKKNENRSRHVGIYNRKDSVNRVWRWIAETSIILVEVSKQNWY